MPKANRYSLTGLLTERLDEALRGYTHRDQRAPPEWPLGGYHHTVPQVYTCVVRVSGRGGAGCSDVRHAVRIRAYRTNKQRPVFRACQDEAIQHVSVRFLRSNCRRIGDRDWARVEHVGHVDTI